MPTPHHSTNASSLSSVAAVQRTTGNDYLDVTFSVMVEYDGDFQPMVLTMNERCEPLLEQIRHLLAKKNEQYDPEKKQLKVVWGHGRPAGSPDKTDLTDSNITAMFRLVKARNGVDYIATTKHTDH